MHQFVPRLIIVLTSVIPGPGLRAGPVEDWNGVLVAAIQAESTPPCLVARNLAVLHAAMHDAVNAAEPRFQPYLPTPAPPPDTGASPDAAAIFAGHDVALALYPGRSADFEALLARERQSLGAGAAAARGQELGSRAARGMLEARAGDGSSTTVHYVPKEGPGQWRRPPSNRPPELPGWPKVIPFCLERASQFRPPGPPVITSAAYAKDFEVLRRLGGVGSTERTAEQTMLAKFWADFAYTSTPPGHWNDIARTLSLEKQLSLHDSARLFAWLNLALADTGIAVWECKYHYNWWRPGTALTGTAGDGNGATAPAPDWKPLLKVPPHPEYVSGHSAFSSAAAAVLQQVFGSGTVSFSATSMDVKDVTRTYHSFAACRDEIGLSRIWGGIHFPMANADGKILGARIAADVVARRLLPINR